MIGWPISRPISRNLIGSKIQIFFQGEVERKNGEAAPTKMDLIGFWELVSIQVDQSKSSLKELHDKKDNNWKVKHFY